MKLSSMKVTPDDDDSYGGVSPSSSQYGYGLMLSLNDEQVKALGLDRSLPAGTVVRIEAEAIVQSSTESVDRDGDKGPSICMSVQITDLGLQPVGTDENAADKLYGAKG